MLRSSSLAGLWLLSACGGGGGGSSVAGDRFDLPARVAAEPIEIGPTSSVAELLVQLTGSPLPPPTLLELAIELPPALSLPASDRVRPATTLVDLDGDFVPGDAVGDRFVVLCGDAQNPAAVPLAAGPLFHLRLLPTNPRTVGTWPVVLRDLRAAASDGRSVPSGPDPVTVQVTIR
jgi:hypothetical protein